MKFLAIISLLLLIACGTRNVSIDKDKDELDKVCDSFMQFFSKGKFNEAIRLLKDNSVLEQEKIDTIQAEIARHSVNVFSFYGKMISPEFITERKIKDFLAKRFYILKFDKYYLKFDFTLYKSTLGWKITSFSYDEGLVELLY